MRCILIEPSCAPCARRIRARQRAASSAGANGLLRKSSAPRSSALTRSARVQRAVRTSVGKVLPALRKRRTSVNPSLPGSPTSTTARSKLCVASSASAASALVTRVALQFALVKPRTTASATMSSSSTIKSRMGGSRSNVAGGFEPAAPRRSHCAQRFLVRLRERLGEQMRQSARRALRQAGIQLRVHFPVPGLVLGIENAALRAVVEALLELLGLEAREKLLERRLHGRERRGVLGFDLAEILAHRFDGS